MIEITKVEKQQDNILFYVSVDGIIHVIAMPEYIYSKELLVSEIKKLGQEKIEEINKSFEVQHELKGKKVNLETGEFFD